MTLDASCWTRGFWTSRAPPTASSSVFRSSKLSEHRGVAGRAAGQGDEDAETNLPDLWPNRTTEEGHEAMSTTVMQQGSMSRAQKIANAQELRAQGLVFR